MEHLCRQLSQSHVSNPLPLSPVPSHQQVWSDMSRPSTGPVLNISMTHQDNSPIASPLQSPFSAHNVTIPNAFDGSEDEMSRLGLGSDSFFSTGPRRSDVRPRSISDLHRENGDPLEPEFPELNYDIRLLDVELPELGKGACGEVKEAICMTPDGEVIPTCMMMGLIATSFHRCGTSLRSMRAIRP